MIYANQINEMYSVHSFLEQRPLANIKDREE